MRNILIVAGGAVAVAAIALAVWFGTRPSGPAPAPVAVQAAPDKKALLAVQPTDHVMGDANASILMIEYASFTCPHCAAFHTQILPEIKKKWIDTGKVKLVYRDFPLDQAAAKAAQLAECMPKDRYFAVTDMIFRTQPQWITGSDPVAELAKGLRIAGMGDNEVKESYLIPRGKHVTVHPGDRVRSGDKLCDGPVDPHDILRISGDAEVQRYLVEEIQAVYRLQGVTISDKHIECIVRQMMRKVVIENPGDTELLEGEEISKARLREENNRIGAKNGAAATFRPLLLGITKASLATDSFISAASFQETTKVLTHAAIAGKMDTLEGLKENVIMGHLIPSGTGNMRVNDVRVKDLDAEAEEAAAAHAAAQELAGETSGMEALFSQETAG